MRSSLCTKPCSSMCSASFSQHVCNRALNPIYIPAIHGHRLRSRSFNNLVEYIDPVYAHLYQCCVCVLTVHVHYLQAAINSEVIGNFDSYTGSTFNALGIEAVEVHNFTFTTVGLTENEWISFVEVRSSQCCPTGSAVHALFVTLLNGSR